MESEVDTKVPRYCAWVSVDAQGGVVDREQEGWQMLLRTNLYRDPTAVCVDVDDREQALSWLDAHGVKIPKDT